MTLVIQSPQVEVSMFCYNNDMDLEKIKQIIEYDIPQEQKESMILQVIGKDESVLIYMLGMLSHERQSKKELIQDLNLEVSRYHIHINDKSLLKKNLNFLNKETKSLYERWKCYVKPLFNNKFNED